MLHLDFVTDRKDAEGKERKRHVIQVSMPMSISGEFRTTLFSSEAPFPVYMFLVRPGNRLESYPALSSAEFRQYFVDIT